MVQTKGFIEVMTSGDSGFFIVTLTCGIIMCLLVLAQIAQLCKMQPMNDMFILKGSIYLIVAALLRVTSCFIIYFFWKYDDTPG